jgi:hypothetical protein
VPIDAQKLSEHQYKILESIEYSDFEEFPFHIYEFWPGDIIELTDFEFSDGNNGKVASRLVKSGNWPNRKLREFKFKASLKQLSNDRQTVIHYFEEIKCVKNEIAKGKFNYQQVIDYVALVDTH